MLEQCGYRQAHGEQGRIAARTGTARKRPHNRPGYLHLRDGPGSV